MGEVLVPELAQGAEVVEDQPFEHSPREPELVAEGEVVGVEALLERVVLLEVAGISRRSSSVLAECT
jgi:hypothetical protein